jgi:hypothetical protein
MRLLRDNTGYSSKHEKRDVSVLHFGVHWGGRISRKVLRIMLPTVLGAEPNANAPLSRWRMSNPPVTYSATMELVLAILPRPYPVWPARNSSEH